MMTTITTEGDSGGGSEDADANHSDQVLKVCHVRSIKFLKDLIPYCEMFLNLFFLADRCPW